MFLFSPSVIDKYDLDRSKPFLCNIIRLFYAFQDTKRHSRQSYELPLAVHGACITSFDMQTHSWTLISIPLFPWRLRKAYNEISIYAYFDLYILPVWYLSMWYYHYMNNVTQYKNDAQKIKCMCMIHWKYSAWLIGIVIILAQLV